jgi:ABC-type siderophore export system fused ATPase/permease subunit
MPIEPKRYQELIEKHEEAHHAAKSDTFRDLLMTCGHLLFWVLCGLAFLGMALHTTDASWGSIFWKAGHLIWIAGVLFSLLAAYRRGEKRGDW